MSDHYAIRVPRKHAYRILEALEWASEMAYDHYEGSDSRLRRYKAFELALDEVHAELRYEQRKEWNA